MAETPTLMEIRSMSPIEWVREERTRQTRARGNQDHNAFKWFTILAEEFGEVAQVLEKRTEDRLGQEEYERELEYELIQTAAVAVAWVEAIRRSNGTERAPICVCKRCAGGEDGLGA